MSHPDTAPHVAQPQWPAIAAVALFAVALAVLTAVSTQRNGGAFVYALDDPYIHMAMAKNVAQHGVWGVSATEFSSSSSSLLWTAVLAGLFAVFGVHHLVPFILNIVVAVALILLFHRQLTRAEAAVGPVMVFVLLVAAVFTAPLPGLVFVGQEHILHALVTLLFVERAAQRLADGAGGVRDRAFVVLSVLAALLPVLRYEAMFLVAIVSALLLAQRRWREAATLMIAAALPLTIYGAISVSLGWYWVPNSVLLKGTRPSLDSFTGVVRAMGYDAYTTIISLPALAFLLYSAIAAFAFGLTRQRAGGTQWMLGIFVLLALTHAQFAQPQAFWFFRYEAYLVVLGLMAVGRAAVGWFTALGAAGVSRPRLALIGGVAAALLMVSPLPDRALMGLRRVPQATTNIYEQQYQMGQFVRRFYDGTAVALNDIGAPSFFADISCVDLVGLANMEVASRLLNRWYAYDDIQEIAAARDVRIAIVYDSWFRGRLPPSWRKAGTWTIRNNLVTGSDTVSFYAVQPEELPVLTANLRAFAADLPPTVTARLN